MMTYNNANCANLPTTAAPAPEKTYDKRDRAVSAAIKALGPQAVIEFDFTVTKCDKRWLWRAVAADKRPPLSAQQVKANGGKKAAAVLVSAPDRIAGEAVASAAAEKIMADARKPIDLTVDENGIPIFLKRGGDTSPEARDALIAKHKKTTGPDRQIKNPPNVTKKTNKGPAGPASQQRADGLKAGSPGAILVDTVCRKEGATNEELCKAVGWKQCLPAMKKYADKAGVTITTKKEKGEPTRYFGTR